MYGFCFVVFFHSLLFSLCFCVIFMLCSSAEGFSDTLAPNAESETCIRMNLCHTLYMDYKIFKPALVYSDLAEDKIAK